MKGFRGFCVQVDFESYGIQLFILSTNQSATGYQMVTP